MSKERALEKVRDLKAEVMGLRNRDALASDNGSKELILRAAMALEMLEKRLERPRRTGTAFTPPPGLAGREDVRMKQLPPVDRR